MPSKSLILIFISLILVGCGDGGGEWLVIKRQEPDTLLREGTALNAEETQRRVDEEAESMKESEGRRRLFKLESALLAAKSADRRAELILSLAELGPAALTSLPAIDRFQDDPSGEVRAALLEAHWAIQPEAAGPLIFAALKDESAPVRRSAVTKWALHDPTDLSPLVRGLADDDAGVQYAAISGLTAAASLPKELLSEVGAGIDKMSGSVAKAAFDLLLAHAQDLPDFPAALERSLDHHDLTVRLNAIEKAKAAGLYSNAYARKIVQTVMEDPEPAVRASAYRWLQRLAPAGFPVLDPEAEYSERIEAHEAFQAWLQALPK